MEYKEDEILSLIVGILKKSMSNVGYPPYNYKVFLDMEPEEALKLLSFRLRIIRDIDRGSKRDFHFYFSTEFEYMSFLIESALAECLNVFFILKRDKKQIPPLYDTLDMYGTLDMHGIHKKFLPGTMYEMTPFGKWLKDCQSKKIKPIRTVTK
ncbi:MAG: hypothetical protein E4H47_00845 [Parcubacteria group bacterium]|nr:MAG: hypothetical protein E4H47_00845 [Parcubacteria group bacterium]